MIKDPYVKEPLCPYCQKPLSWDQFKEIWHCRTHGTFDDSQLKIPKRSIINEIVESRTLQKFSKEALCDELAKREGVEEIEVPEDRKWRTTVTDEDGFGDEWGKGYGAARILVVKS